MTAFWIVLFAASAPLALGFHKASSETENTGPFLVGWVFTSFFTGLATWAAVELFR